MSPPRITIDANLSREGLLELRDAIDVLLGADEAESAGLGGIVRRRRAERKVAEVWGRVGPNIRNFLLHAANWPDDREFTMTDIAEEMGTGPKTVRSWHRNLGRTLRHVEETMPEPKLLLYRWDGAQNLYRMPPEVRSAVLKQR